MKKKIKELFLHYLLVLLFVSVIVAVYVTFEDFGISRLSNILLQSLIFTIVINVSAYKRK